MHKGRKRIPEFNFDGLSKLDEDIVRYMLKYTKSSINELANRFNLSKRVVEKIVKSLTEKHIIALKGNVKGGHWELFH